MFTDRNYAILFIYNSLFNNDMFEKRLAYIKKSVKSTSYYMSQIV